MMSSTHSPNLVVMLDLSVAWRIWMGCPQWMRVTIHFKYQIIKWQHLKLYKSTHCLLCARP